MKYILYYIHLQYGTRSNEQQFQEKSTNKNTLPSINIPLIYANGVVAGLTLTDIQLTANVNGKPVCILVLPFPSAKSLMDALRLAIEDFEKR